MTWLFLSLKSGRISTLGYRNIPEAKKDVSDYLMGYYNQQRPHSFNDGIASVAAQKMIPNDGWSLDSCAG
ncbi:hypothetical protein HVA01_00810 [Halovibrio variabilis]|uniref:Integrase catalytic domain-containing protein n=1 Tax=Halovibrio variabilis TaxID=31910 RepID=A0A511UIP6_9GAMM|nr:hypothetical protein HVA01_00810 [Halovibrio variabilis]